MKNILICGYIGYENCGDEAIFQVVSDYLKKNHPDAHITVISGNPDHTAKKYEVDTVYRYDIWKICQILKRTDALLFGGGGLLQNITSSRSLYYYLLILKMAQMHGVKTMVYGNGMGPLRGRLHRWCTKRCLNRVDIITVRDQNSAGLLREIGVDKREILITADPVFGWEVGDRNPNHSPVFEGLEQNNMPYAGIAVRSWKKADEFFVEKMACFCDRLNEEYGMMPIFIPMQFETDYPVSKEIVKHMKTKACLIEKPLTMYEVRSLISSAVIVVGMRLHALIFAALHSIPVIALSYDPKVEGFMNWINQPFILDVEAIDIVQLNDMLSQLMEEYTSIKEDLQIQLDGLKRGSDKNRELFDELLQES